MWWNCLKNLQTNNEIGAWSFSKLQSCCFVFSLFCNRSSRACAYAFHWCVWMRLNNTVVWTCNQNGALSFFKFQSCWFLITLEIKPDQNVRVYHSQCVSLGARKCVHMTDAFQLVRMDIYGLTILHNVVESWLCACHWHQTAYLDLCVCSSQHVVDSDTNLIDSKSEIAQH